MKSVEQALLRRLREREIALAKTASEAWEMPVTPVVIIQENGELEVELMHKEFTINELMWTMFPEGLE